MNEQANGVACGGLDPEELAEQLYEWSGGIFWRGETTWQDRHREEARQWFAYSDLLDDRVDRDAALARVAALADEWAGHVLPPEAGHLVDAVRAALHLDPS